MRIVSALIASALGLIPATALAFDQINFDQGFDRLDANHDGTITRGEFLAGRHARFVALDLDHNGYLTPADIPTLAAFVSPQAAQAPAMLARFDANHDGRVSETEFVRGSMTMFDAADVNHDGLLTRAEAGAAKASLRGGYQQ